VIAGSQVAAASRLRSQVQVQVATRAGPVPRAEELRRWAGAALASSGEAGAVGTLTIRLVGWSEGRHLNENFRGREGPTNVLAFAAPRRGLPVGERELGDVVICLPLARREAASQGRSPRAHLAHLVVHGTLHLLGYRHHRSAAARKMQSVETRIIRRLGFADPYRAAPRKSGRSRRRGNEHG
jgi:probable rRNA maturation factor